MFRVCFFFFALLTMIMPLDQNNGSVDRDNKRKSKEEGEKYCSEKSRNRKSGHTDAKRKKKEGMSFFCAFVPRKK